MPRTLQLLLLLSVGGAGAAGVYFVSESRRVAAHNRHLERRSIDLEHRSARLDAGLADALDQQGRLREDLVAAVEVGAHLLQESEHMGWRSVQLEMQNRRLEAELHEALRQRDEFNRTLDDRIAEIRDARREQAERTKETFGPMPEGVRLALVALNRCLSEDGYPEVRFLWAREISDRTMHDVELIEHNRDTLSTTVYLAGRATLHFDRERGQLTARLFEGHRRSAGLRERFPDEGEPVSFTDLQGPMWESRLGYLIRVEGEYPVPEKAEPVAGLPRDVSDLWKARFERLLESAGTEVTYRVEQIGGLRDAEFQDVLLLGYHEGKTLKSAVEAKRLAVVVDSEAATVELVLEDGVLRKSGGETTIGAQGYRILLPHVTRAQAIDLMMGMVVHR